MMNDSFLYKIKDGNIYAFYSLPFFLTCSTESFFIIIIIIIIIIILLIKKKKGREFSSLLVNQN